MKNNKLEQRLNRLEKKINEIQWKPINNIINEDLYKFNDELNTFKFLENDFEEHSLHYYQLECLVEYLKQLKRRINNEK